MKDKIQHPDPRTLYGQIVREIHIIESRESRGDNVAHIDLAGMIQDKERLAKKLGLTPDQQKQIFDQVTADSPYRQHEGTVSG